MVFQPKTAEEIQQAFEDRKAESAALEADIPGMSSADLKVIAKLLADQNRWLRSLVRIAIMSDQGV